MKMQEVVRHYFVCALWASTDDNDVPLDQNYSLDDIDNESLAIMTKEVVAFTLANKELLRTWQGTTTVEEQTGHDFWLTRNGHGAGFWESEWGEVREQLDKAAKAYGECSLYVGDDEKIHFCNG